MYQVVDILTVIRTPRRLVRGRVDGTVSRTVILLGVTSMFTDISSEMVTTILPVYIVSVLGLSPLVFGVIDGLNRGAASVVRLVGGYAADRTGRHKEVAAVGYGISAACRLVLALVGGAWGAIVTVIVADRIGKGLRTAPRDALISLSTSPAYLGAAFGVHRALDTLGAMLGPLIAFVLLAMAPGAYNTLFLLSFCFAVIGFAVLVLLVDGKRRGGADPDAPPTPRDVVGLLGHTHLRRVAVAGGLLALCTVSDGFVYLQLQRRLDLDLRWVPLLFVGSAATFMLLAIPIGRLADRVGRRRVFLSGYVLLAALYALLLAPGAGTATLVGALFLVGAVAACTDGVLAAAASAILPEDLRASGLSLVSTAQSIAGLGASIVFGGLWAAFGVDVALVAFIVALGIGLAVGAIMLRSVPDTGRMA